jgi:hypothetical protein
MELDQVRSACRSLTVLGICAGWGLAALGLLLGLLDLLDAVAVGAEQPAIWAWIVLRVAFLAAAGALAGWGAWILSRLASAVILAYFERFARISDELETHANRALVTIERIGSALEQRGESADPAVAGRARSLTEIGRATRSAQWVEAEALLREFDLAFPGDASSAALRDDLAAARRGSIEASLAEIKAAREVNDPDRVLELYHVLAPGLETGPRRSLESELATWFLGVIHGRLRSGKIQADIVHLAGRFAESFAATIQGASVRASLATLRRSVGLCPVCAQPYAGIADSCPQCSGRVAAPPAGASTAPEQPRRE